MTFEPPCKIFCTGFKGHHSQLLHMCGGQGYVCVAACKPSPFGERTSVGLKFRPEKVCFGLVGPHWYKLHVYTQLHKIVYICTRFTRVLSWFSTGYSPGGNNAHLAPEILNAKPGPKRFIDYSKQPVWAAGALMYELAGENVLYTATVYSGTPLIRTP